MHRLACLHRAGIESEMELASNGLHQLCAPMLDYLDRLPAPQHDALATVFGMSEDTPPDRFLVGLVTLALTAEAAEQQPLHCIVEDAQRLDHASAQVFGFADRRLLAERVALVAPPRAPTGDQVLADLPEMSINGLDDSDARTLLLENVPGASSLQCATRSSPNATVGGRWGQKLRVTWWHSRAGVAHHGEPLRALPAGRLRKASEEARVFLGRDARAARAGWVRQQNRRVGERGPGPATSDFVPYALLAGIMLATLIVIQRWARVPGSPLRAIAASRDADRGR